MGEPARVIMIQGTASHVGKSLLVTALCRIFHQDGFRVAPFKAQNMSLNATVTADGDEIARAQAVQALAAGVEPTVEMNPILLKPKPDGTSQLIVMGRPKGDISWHSSRTSFRAEALAVIAAALDRLRRRVDIVVIEGAGSPAEINLMGCDVANMAVAELAAAPVLLVGDIDRGGVFAAFLGTYEILPAQHRRRLAGYVINKFRGDPSLLEPAVTWLQQRTGVPVLGIIPFLPEPGIDEEDSVAFDAGRVAFRRAWLNRVRRRRGQAPLPLPAAEGRAVEGASERARLEPALNRLAAHVREHIDLAAIYALLGRSARCDRPR